MTKSKGVGRGFGSGGPRPGAGRKPLKGASKVEAEAKTEAPAAAPLPDFGDTLNGEPNPKNAVELEGLALAALRQIIRSSPSDAARVTAAKEVLVRANAERELLGQNGKKEIAKNVAHERIAAGGKFSAPPPPRAAREVFQ